MLYGPAYKGIPLVASVAVAFFEGEARDIPYAFNRKEAKDHGEGGTTVGAPLSGRVLIVDDVISAGTASRESLAIIGAAGAAPVGFVISLESRGARGSGGSPRRARCARTGASRWRRSPPQPSSSASSRRAPNLAPHAPAMRAYLETLRRALTRPH